MTRFTTIQLIGKTYATDQIGQKTPLESKRLVMANINSISAAEFFRAGENGLKANIMFSIWLTDYLEEEEIEFNGTRYSVYRTFVNDKGRIELYCQKKVSNE